MPKTPSKGARPMSRSLRVYQKAAIVFMIVALLLLLAVLYLSVSQATITVVPNQRVVSTTVSVEVASKPRALGQVSGYVIEDTFAKAKTFEIPEEGGTPVEQKAGGTVTLINETSSSQPLVATTRLLSEEGVLFRLDEAVTIPANGTVDAVAHADEPGLMGEIGPTQFTIPGLSTSLQEVIYAVSVEPMTGGVQYITVLSQEHLDQAVSDLEQDILEEAKNMLKERFDAETFDGEVYISEVTEKVSDTEPGTETGSFNVSLTTKVTGVFYSTDLLANYAEADLFTRVSSGHELTSVNAKGLQVEVQSVDPEAQTATLSIYLDGLAILSTSADVLDLDRFVGKSGDEIVTMLESSDAIKEASVSFTPFWLQRVPRLKDHIKIIVEKAE